MAEINKRSTKQESQAVAAFGVTAGIQEGVIISARNPHYPNRLSGLHNGNMAHPV